MNRNDQIRNMRRQIDRHNKPDIFDRMERSPGKTMLGLGLVAVILNLLFWGAIIVMVVFGLTFIL